MRRRVPRQRGCGDPEAEAAAVMTGTDQRTPPAAKPLRASKAPAGSTSKAPAGSPTVPRFALGLLLGPLRADRHAERVFLQLYKLRPCLFCSGFSLATRRTRLLQQLVQTAQLAFRDFDILLVCMLERSQPLH